MELSALTDFDLVAIHGGFGRAARASGRPKASLSRHVAELERALGVRLVERGANALRLTEEGRALHERTHALLAELNRAGDDVLAGAPLPQGRLRISAPVVLAHVVLAGVATRFALDHPQVRLEIVAEDRVADPVEDGYDLVIRINPRADDRLFGRRILGDERVLVASVPRPTGMARRAKASGGAIPAVLPTTMPPGASWSIRSDAHTRITLVPEPVLRLSSLLMVREAVLLGAGVALLPRLLVADDVAAGRLCYWGVEDAPPVEIWALQSSHRLISAKVRAFLDAFAATYPDKVVPSPRAAVASLRGRRP